MSNTYLTVRDLDSVRSGNGGRFHINEHNSESGICVAWGQHSYKHLRQARRAAKALAAKRKIDYRQDKEYEDYDEGMQIVTESVDDSTAPVAV